MKTVGEVSKLSGVSVRTLHFYDSEGLLPPASVTDAGYRLYDNESLKRLQSIMLLRELDFPLTEIKAILSSPSFNCGEAIKQQIELLKIKRERLDGMISFAQQLYETGESIMDFSAFDNEKQKRYTKQAKERWGNTEAYREFEQKGLKDGEMAVKSKAMMDIFTELGKIKDKDPNGEEAIALAKKLQDFITANFYTCTDEIFGGLGEMYAAEGEMKDNIDAAGGAGTAEFASKAIKAYCAKR